MNIIFFDVETTGLNPKEDKIIELAYHYYKTDNNNVHVYDELIKRDGLRLTDKIVNLTGISNKMLRDDGIAEVTVADDFYTLLCESVGMPTVLIAHNLQFDLNFIYELLCGYYCKEDVDGVLSELYYLDTLTILKDRKTYPHKLVDMCTYYDIDLGEDNFHRAVYDAELLIDSVKGMICERDDLKDYINLVGYHPKYGVFGREFPWLNYKRQGYTKGLCSVEDSLPHTLI